jgi:hypothetical protein
MSCTARWGEEIRVAVTEGLGPEGAAALRAHRATCPACAAAYDTAALAVDALEGHAEGLPEAVRADLGAGLFAQLEAEGALAPEPAARSVTPAPPTTSPRRRGFVWASAGVALAAGLAVTVGRAGPDLAEPTTEAAPLDAPPAYAPRGGASGGLGFGLYCIGLGNGAPRIESTAFSGSGRPARCALEDRLQFTYSVDAGHALAPTNLALIGVGPEGEFAWYWPRGEDAFVLETPARQAPLPGSFELAVRHRPGRWHVYGIFGRRPLTRETLAPSLGPAPRAALAALEDLGDFAVTEAVLDIAVPGDPPEGRRP